MAISEKETLHYWNYFCSLCKRLDNTRQYVDHGSNNNILRNAEVNSFEFQQLITLTAIEFENISKLICLDIDSTFNLQHANIKQITEKILGKYPKIGETIVLSDYQNIQPLKEWGTYIDPTDNKKKVKGIKWWDDYSDIKHQTYWKFDLATLENAVNALASLMVMELYLMKISMDSVNMSLNKPCAYFSSPYPSNLLCTREKALPDFDGARTNELIEDGTLFLNTL